MISVSGTFFGGKPLSKTTFGSLAPLAMAEAARGALFPIPSEGERDGGMAQTAGFKYPNDNIVMVAGQYREVRPMLAQGAGAGRFHCEPAELPLGLQLDSATGTIWGTPASPPPNMDPAGPYQQYTVVQTNAAGATACNVGIKVVQFNPQNFSISHISQLEKSKYMVLVDTRRKQG